MRSISSSVAARSQAALPITYWRTAEWPTMAPTLTARPRRSRTSRYSAKLSNSQRMPFSIASSDMPSTYSSMRMSVRRSPGRQGASVKPQLPVTIVVTPCQEEQEASGSHVSWAS